MAFPLLAGPFAPWVFAGNMTANLMRNVWSYMIIFCGHFPEDVQEFSIEETKAETRGGWYFRQILGSANLTGGKLFHILSGNLSFQIEHHLFPDVPAHRHAEIAPEVQEICKRYGIPYNKGPLPKQFATVVRKIVKLALPQRLTVRAPERHPVAASPDSLLAARYPTSLPRVPRVRLMAVPQRRHGSPAVHPHLLPSPGVAGGRSIRARPVQPQHVAGPLHHPQRVLHRTHRRRRQVPEDEAQLVAVHVSDACHHPLIEQRLGQRPVRIGDEVGGRDVRIPVVAKQIGPEVGDGVLVVGAVENLQHAEVDSGGLHVTGLQDDADAVARAARPVRAGDPPAAVHLQVRVDARLADPDEQVLAAADDLVDPLPGQVDGGVARHANIAARQRLSRQRLAQLGGGVKDGVTFGHRLPGHPQRDFPQPFGVGRVERVCGHPAAARRAPSFDDRGLVAVLEIAAADAVERRRRRQQHRRRRALLDGLDRLSCFIAEAACPASTWRPSRVSKIAPGISAFDVIPSSVHRRVTSTANSTLAVLDCP